MVSTSPPTRIGLVAASASRANGGVFEALVVHAELVRDLGHEPVVIALADEHSEADRHRFGAAEVEFAAVTGPGSVGFAPGLAATLRRSRLDLLHLHGIWMYPSAAAAGWAQATGRPYVISPHGMLDPWILSHGRWKKAVAMAAYERKSWRRASMFHALTSREADDIADVAGEKTTVVIPNAVALSRHLEGDSSPYVLYLGRIHPKKNLEALIDGWRLAADVLRPRGARLLIAGWGEPEHVDAVKTQLAAGGHDDIELLGPVYGDRKRDLLAGARFLALASHSEGLPMTILEAWAAGTPTVNSEHCNLPSGFERGAAIDSGTTPESVAQALRTGFALDADQWRSLSEAGTRLVAELYAPDVIRARWAETYGDLLDRSLV